MERRLPKFNEDESEQISFYAREAARLGEDFIWDLVTAKLELAKLKLYYHSSADLQQIFPSIEALQHEIDVVNQVVLQARVILQMEGRDEMSQLDHYSIEAGLGSIFDPESKIRERIRYFGFDPFSDNV